MTDTFLPFTEAAVRELTTAADHMAVADFLAGILARAPLAGQKNLYGPHRMILGCLATELRTLAFEAGEPSHLTPREQEREADKLDRAVDSSVMEHVRASNMRSQDRIHYGSAAPEGLERAVATRTTSDPEDLSWLG